MSGIHGALIGAGGGFRFVETLTSNTLNYNLRTRAIASGWDQSTPLVATVNIMGTISNPVWVCSNSIFVPAFDTGFAAYPAGSVLYLNISDGEGNVNSYIAGAGGAGGSTGGTIYAPWPNSTPTDTRVGPQSGGTALRVSLPSFINNWGGILAGGAGGGNGSVSIDYYTGGCDKNGCYDNSISRYLAGGGGGGRSNPLYNSLAGLVPVVTSNVTIGPTGGFSLAAQNGTQGTSNSAGSGGLGERNQFNPSQFFAGSGGAGGGYGAAGSSGSTINISARTVPAQLGGAVGPAVVGNSFITWLVTGTRLGTIL